MAVGNANTDIADYLREMIPDQHLEQQHSCKNRGGFERAGRWMRLSRASGCLQDLVRDCKFFCEGRGREGRTQQEISAPLRDSHRRATTLRGAPFHLLIEATSTSFSLVLRTPPKSHVLFAHLLSSFPCLPLLKALDSVFLLPVTTLLETGRFPSYYDASRKKQLVAGSAITPQSQVLFVSHPWESPGNPDPSGKQFLALRRFLEGPRGDGGAQEEGGGFGFGYGYVWLSFSCTSSNRMKPTFQTHLHNVITVRGPYRDPVVIVIVRGDPDKLAWCYFLEQVLP